MPPSNSRHAIWTIVGLLAVVTIFLFFLENPVSLDDGLSHFAFARMMRTEGIFPAQGWDAFVSEGTMSRISVNPYFLSHVLMIPLTLLPPVIALKILTILFIALVLFAMWLVLRSLKLDPKIQAWFLLLFFLGNHIFLGRTLLARPFTLVTALYLLLLFAIIDRRRILAGVILAVTVLASHLFVFSLAASVVGVGWLIAQKRTSDALRLGSAIVCGIGLGLILHPQTSAYVLYLSDVFLRLPFQHPGSISELRFSLQWSAASILSWASVAIGVGVSGFAVSSLSKAQRTKHPEIFYVALLTLGLIPCAIFWIRAMDFLWPTIAVLVAASIAAFLRNGKKIDIPFHAFLFDLLGIVCILQTALVGSTIVTRNANHDLEAYSAMERIPPDNVVLNLQWDRLPVFVLLRPDLRYVLGMDPRFLAFEHPELFAHLEEAANKSADAKWNAATWLAEAKGMTHADVLVIDKREKMLIDRIARIRRPLIRTGALAVFSL
ncbi:hypothetical protein HYZ99_04550 [Candidatus Peregrinibacteria bacterium]|nr:hypothetical protein [Candidatus Peregrinibacteria bacterium]